ncbi:hypothetical protein BDW72DRAFT_172420 [Aspergillus terricola var. indicus]
MDASTRVRFEALPTALHPMQICNMIIKCPSRLGGGERPPRRRGRLDSVLRAVYGLQSDQCLLCSGRLFSRIKHPRLLYILCSHTMILHDLIKFIRIIEREGGNTSNLGTILTTMTRHQRHEWPEGRTGPTAQADGEAVYSLSLSLDVIYGRIYLTTASQDTNILATL